MMLLKAAEIKEDLLKGSRFLRDAWSECNGIRKLKRSGAPGTGQKQRLTAALRLEKKSKYSDSTLDQVRVIHFSSLLPLLFS